MTKQPHADSLAAYRPYEESSIASGLSRFRVPGDLLVTICLSLFLVTAGGGMQSYANKTAGAVLFALLLLLAGMVFVSGVFAGGKFELQAFLLMFGVGVFAGGMAQCYSLAFFDGPQSTLDALTFFRHISPSPPFKTSVLLIPTNSPLAVSIWQTVYKVTWWLEFKFGSYVGVMFNAAVMGINGSITIRCGRLCFGDDAWRLKRVGRVFAFCGLFVLFSALLIRDCFTLFFSVLVLWVTVRWITRQSLANLLIAIAVTGVSAYAMADLRPESALLFGLYGGLAFLVWLISDRLNAARLCLIVCALGLIMIATPYIVNYMKNIQEIQNRQMASYGSHSERQAGSSDSMGMRMVVNQPLALRLIFGTGALLINPIPLWHNFKIGAHEYHWIKGYHGIYQVLVLPLVFTGCLLVWDMYRTDRKRAAPLLFLVSYLAVNLGAVAVTSMEPRHVAQFLPAFMILSAVPDTRDVAVRQKLRPIAVVWFAAIILLHLIWALMKV